MKKPLLLAFILIAFISEAQIQRYSFKAAANYPFIPDVKTSQDLAVGIPVSAGYGSYTVKATLKQTFESHVGFDVSGNVDYSVSNKFFITTGLSVSYLRFKQSFTVEDLGNAEAPLEFPVVEGVGVPFGSIYGDIIFRDADGNASPTPTSPGLIKMSDKVGETTTLYLQAPVLAGTSLVKGKLLIRAGATFSVLLNATTYSSEITRNGTNLSVKDVKNNTREGYNEVLASATVQATYLVTKRIGIDLMANKYLSPIYSDSDQENKAKYNVMSLGLSYNLSR